MQAQLQALLKAQPSSGASAAAATAALSDAMSAAFHDIKFLGWLGRGGFERCLKCSGKDRLVQRRCVSAETSCLLATPFPQGRCFVCALGVT